MTTSKEYFLPKEEDLEKNEVTEVHLLATEDHEETLKAEAKKDEAVFPVEEKAEEKDAKGQEDLEESEATEAHRLVTDDQKEILKAEEKKDEEDFPAEEKGAKDVKDFLREEKAEAKDVRGQRDLEGKEEREAHLLATENLEGILKVAEKGEEVFPIEEKAARKDAKDQEDLEEKEEREEVHLLEIEDPVEGLASVVVDR